MWPSHLHGAKTEGELFKCLINLKWSYKVKFRHLESSQGLHFSWVLKTNRKKSAWNWIQADTGRNKAVITTVQFIDVYYVPSTVVSIVHLILITNYKAGTIIIPIFHRNRWRQSDVRLPAWGHTFISGWVRAAWSQSQAPCHFTYCIYGEGQSWPVPHHDL